MMINKNLIKKISEKTKLDLLLIKQMPVKLYLERPVHYLCKDLKTNKEYLLAVAYTDAQICRLKKVDDNSKLFIKEWSDYFLFNPPDIWKKIKYILYCLNILIIASV